MWLGYRDKRENDLTVLAQRIGNKVRKTGRSFAMEPMNPYERRIIHSAIGKMEGAQREQGEGRDRRVVIYSTAPPMLRPTTPTASAARGQWPPPRRQPQWRLPRRTRQQPPEWRSPQWPPRRQPWSPSFQRA